MNKEIYNATMEELGGVANQGRRMTLGFLLKMTILHLNNMSI